MKVDLKGFNSTALSRIIQHFRDTAIRAQLNIDGHNYDKRSKTLEMPDCTIIEYITSPFIIKDYSVFLEIPQTLSGPIPSTLSWSTKHDDDGNEIPVTWEDAEIRAEGKHGDNLVHFDQHTAQILKSDVRALLNAGISIINKTNMLILLKNPHSQYYKNIEEMI